MRVIRVRGERSNLIELAKDLRADTDLSARSSITLTTSPRSSAESGYDLWAELVIAFTSGLFTSVTYDLLKLAIKRASDHGDLDVSEEEYEDDSQIAEGATSSADDDRQDGVEEADEADDDGDLDSSSEER